MTPLSHTAQTTPTAREQPGDNAGAPIDHLPNEVLITNLFSYLGPKDVGRASRACRRFNILGRTVWQRRAQQLFQTCSRLFSSFGMTPPGLTPSPEEATAFLDKTIQRVKQINESLPAGLQSQCSTDDLVCKVDPGYMQEFLQKAYDHSLRTLFGELAHVPGNASLEEAVRRIREWLQTAEARDLPELSRGNRQLCCLPGEIGQLTALQELCLGGNQIASLPPEIGLLTALQQLDLESNLLESLPREIGRLTELGLLCLDNNQLTALPREIGQLTALQNLRLNGNQLTSLPPEIGQLTALQWLHLSSNQLASLPKEIGQLTSLNELWLNCNHLTSLPAEVRRLTALQWLHLSSNQLASLPPEIGQLTSLNELWLNCNHLTSLPAEIRRLTELQIFVLTSDQTSLLPTEIGKIEKNTVDRQV